MLQKILIWFFVFLLAAGVSGPSPAAVSAKPTTAPDVLIALVPVPQLILATQLLEDMRNTPMAPAWDNTVDFQSTVVPLYRPDIKGVAYYEFIVKKNKSSDAGFIIVSAGAHDYPIPHWNSGGKSPTEELDAIASAQGVTLSTYYRLDALSYAGEDAKGNFISNRDQLVKIDGLNTGDPNPGDSSAKWLPTSSSETAISPSKGTLSTSGPQSANWTFAAWNSWSELKAGYASTYARLIAQLADRAAPSWDMINRFASDGELLSKGAVRDLPVLCFTPTSITVTGSGAALLSTQLLARSGLNPLYHISVVNDVPGSSPQAMVTITCPNNLVSTFVYTIGHIYLAYLPAVSSAGVSVALASAPAMRPSSVNQVLGWSPWYSLWSMNSVVDAPSFNQMDAHTSYNTSGCHSGCGATAWAMLFAWADYEARAGNWWNYWKPRWGIFRLHGLPSPIEDAVAPLSADPYIDFITSEIRNDILTLCWGDSGATMPWNMPRAYQYLAQRTGARLEAHWNIFGAADDALRNNVVNSIRNRMTPVVIGTGWFSHYPLAMGYSERSRTSQDIFGGWHTDYQRMFWVDQGWGGGGNDWITADTWFSGELYP